MRMCWTASNYFSAQLSLLNDYSADSFFTISSLSSHVQTQIQYAIVIIFIYCWFPFANILIILGSYLLHEIGLKISFSLQFFVEFGIKVIQSSYNTLGIFK